MHSPIICPGIGWKKLSNNPFTDQKIRNVVYPAQLHLRVIISVLKLAESLLIKGHVFGCSIVHIPNYTRNGVSGKATFTRHYYLSTDFVQSHLNRGPWLCNPRIHIQGSNPKKNIRVLSWKRYWLRNEKYIVICELFTSIKEDKVSYNVQ